MLPTIKQLQYLVALADELHFGRAARACHVTQPALSDQIQCLEQLLGVQLFERSRRRVLLTPAGRALSERARRVLHELEDMTAMARSGGEPFATPMRLGVIPTVAPYLLPPLLAHLRREIPALRLFLREELTAPLTEKLAAGELDAALVALPAGDDDALEGTPLFHDPFLLVAHRSHPLARRRRLQMGDLTDGVLLLLEEGHCLRAQALEVCRLAGARDSATFRASSLGTLVQMVANGIGITLLPRLAVEVELRGCDELTAVPFTDPAPRRTVGLVWRAGSARREECLLLAEAIRRGLPALGVETAEG